MRAVLAVTVLSDLTDLIAAHRLVQLRLEAQHLGPQSVGTVHQLGLIIKYQVVNIKGEEGGERIAIIGWAASDHLSWPPCQLCSSHQHCSVAPPPSGSLQDTEISFIIKNTNLSSAALFYILYFNFLACWWWHSGSRILQ